MATENRNLKIDITLEQLKNSIRNEENAGFLLRRMSITIGGEANQLVVEEGPLPASQMEVKELAGAQDEAEATALAKKLHEELPVDAGVLAFGRLSIAEKSGSQPTLVWVAAFRNAGMAIEPPHEGTGGTGLIGAMVARAEAEWEFFGRQETDTNGKEIRDGKDEHEDDASERVHQYWLVGTGDSSLSGKDRDTPWSAAFISYVMKKAGAGKLFKYNAAHQVYIHAAIRAEAEERTDYGFWGVPLTDRKPEVGDLVCAWRKTKDFTGPVTFKMAADGKEYPSHCDLVVAVTDTEIATIGGNVGQSVEKKHFKLDKGFLTPANFDNGFAILINKMGGMAAPVVDRTMKPEATANAGEFKTCSQGWTLTGYFTPVEKDFSGTADFVHVNGVGEESFAEAFLKAVKMEGWGKTRHGWYLGFFSGGFHKGDFAKDALGQPLVIGSVAVDKAEIPFKRKLTMPDLPDDWGKAIYTAVDVGGAINEKHIDVYCGEGVEAEKQTKKLTIKPGTKFPKGAHVCFA